jgi:hypothetical protein
MSRDLATHAGRRARDDEVDAWREHGWVLVDGLIGTDEIDAAAEDLPDLFPTPADYHADPAGETKKWLGEPAPPRHSFTWPPDGPGFRPEQHTWRAEFPFSGSGRLNRLCVHPAIVDLAERLLATDDLRLYQVGVSAKYTGETNYEQPMHTDRNHSWLPPRAETPWLHVESFLYLSDVDAGTAPTHLVSLRDSPGRSPTAPLIMPANDPELYSRERPAAGMRGSLLAYRPDVFHRAVNLTAPGGARFLLNVSFKVAGQDWIGYTSVQSRATFPAWTQFVEGSTPRQLELFGFPPPGHPIWDAALLDETAARYPNLDVAPWRAQLGAASPAVATSLEEDEP